MAQLSTLPGYIGRFRILKVLGKGAQGVVYMAADTQLERNVAIKTIQLDKPVPKIKSQLLSEARTVSKLQHPGIITLYEADEHLGKPYLVFEYVDGISLHDFLKQKGKLSTKDAIYIMKDVLNAIAYAHKRGVIHRDLNPLNIMITQHDKPRIMDFGIATLLGQRNEEGINGTLRYMSPEQCEEKPATAASDIFALGLIMHEMLTGKPAVNLDNRFAIINRIVNEDIDIPDEIEPAMRPILQKALQREHEARYGDALDMLQDLNKHLDNISPDLTASPTGAENHSDTLQFLLRRMAHKRDFPTMSHQVVEVSQKAKTESDISTNALSNAILKDYSLSTKLLRLVNSPLYSHYGGRINTISRAVVILGFEEVRNAALGLMLLDHLKDKNQASALREACIGSLMSGCIAHGVTKKLKIRDSEEAYVCAMFHNLGRLLSIYYFPDEMEVILDLVKHKSMKEEHAALSVLGVTFEEIGIAVGENWKLPAEIIDSMHKLPPGELKKPLSHSDTLKHITSFSNEYCDLIQHSSSEERQQSFEILASRYSNTMNITRGQMEDILSNAMDEMVKYASLVNLDLKDSPIFKKARKWSSAPGEATTVSTEPEEVATSETVLRQENLIQSIQEISDAIVEGASLNDILVMVMETIYRGYNFTRVVFCMINKSRTSLSARFGFGRDVETLIQRFSIPLGNDKDIYNLALKQGNDLIIEDVQDNEHRHLLPRWYRDDYAKTSMMVYPIIVKNIPMGLIYIDSMARIKAVDEGHYSLIKTLRNQIVMAIRQSTSSAGR